ncbi:MAG: hypothetical protein V2A66_01915 [Pseudomonadota bacterium]
MTGILLALSIIATAHPAPLSALECVPGRYAGKTWSANEALHGKEVTLVVTKQKDACNMRFKSPSAKTEEMWELAGNHLVQRDLNEKGKEVSKYGATLEVREGVEGYFIDCAADATKGCDGGADRRTYWRIETKGKNIIYSVWGVDPAKASDPKAAVRKRIEYTFTPAP